MIIFISLLLVVIALYHLWFENHNDYLFPLSMWWKYINEQEEKHWILYECIEIKQFKIMDQGRNEEEKEYIFKMNENENII